MLHNLEIDSDNLASQDSSPYQLANLKQIELKIVSKVWTADCGKDRVLRVQPYFELNFNINFWFFMSNIYLEHIMEYQ